MRDRVPWRSTATYRPTWRRRITSPTSWLRSKSIVTASVAFAALVLLAVPTSAKRTEPDVPVATILTAYDRATHADDVKTFASEGTLAGEGLTGTFRTVRDGTNAREDAVLGPRREPTRRLADRPAARTPTATGPALPAIPRH